jgi:hypothetical protein
MRKMFIEGSKKDAQAACPWASVIQSVCGGYMCFESWDDFYIWKNQK